MKKSNHEVKIAYTIQYLTDYIEYWLMFVKKKICNSATSNMVPIKWASQLYLDMSSKKHNAKSIYTYTPWWTCKTTLWKHSTILHKTITVFTRFSQQVN